MGKSWKDLESQVRALARLIWDREAEAKNIGGVDIDCVVQLSSNNFVLIEITEEETLNKAREDINKIITARNALFSQGVFAKGYFVRRGGVTQAMIDAGKSHHIDCVSFAKFQRILFDFEPPYDRIPTSGFSQTSPSSDTA